MYCIIANKSEDEFPHSEGEKVGGESNLNGDEMLQYYNDNIISSATNQSIFTPLNSDLHAEAAAIASFASNPTSKSGLKGATCYVTMPPCKNCFMLLCGAKIGKIVSCREMDDNSMRVAGERGKVHPNQRCIIQS